MVVCEEVSKPSPVFPKYRNARPTRRKAHFKCAFWQFSIAWFPEAPILVAANREEFYSRPSNVPSIQSGKPRVLSGVDQTTGGTWLGVNQHGLFVGVCNRPKYMTSLPARSRGLLCRDLLKAASSRKAVDMALDELSTNKYDGCSFVCADAESGWVDSRRR